MGQDVAVCVETIFVWNLIKYVYIYIYKNRALKTKENVTKV